MEGSKSGSSYDVVDDVRIELAQLALGSDGELRCGNLLILSCQTDVGIGKKDWGDALSFIFEGLQFEVCTSCCELTEHFECIWKFVIKFQNPGDLDIARACLLIVIASCEDVTAGDENVAEFFLCDLDEKMYGVIRRIRYDDEDTFVVPKGRIIIHSEGEHQKVMV